MKIEKISDYQIRCILNKQDLMERQMRISELAYGTDKAKELFNDMIRQASFECGFVPDDLPLLVEAIPVSSECLVLVITKVDDPEELDARFSDFTASDDVDPEQFAPAENAFADEILNMFKQAKQVAQNAQNGQNTPNEKGGLPGAVSEIKQQTRRDFEQPQPEVLGPDYAKVFSFRTLDEVSHVSRILVKFYKGRNTLYKDPEDGRYFLVVTLSGETPETFNKVCNILSEYSTVENVNYASGFHYEELFETIVKDKATEVMAKL